MQATANGKIEVDEVIVRLPDAGHKSASPIKIKVFSDQNGMYIVPEGYGDFASKDGGGVPVIFEFYNGELRLLVWGDINSQDPTHTISLNGAKEKNRKNS